MAIARVSHKSKAQRTSSASAGVRSGSGIEPEQSSDVQFGAGVSVDLQVLVAEAYAIPWAKLASADVHSVYHGAVGGTEVLQHPTAITEEKASVLARHTQIREQDITRGMATDKELLLSAIPVQRQQRPLLLSMASDGALASTCRGAHPRGQSSPNAALRASQIQVANELWRIDDAALQKLIKPVKERSLAQQPVGVRGVQCPRDSPA
jgi:hypothetical protein